MYRYCAVLLLVLLPHPPVMGSDVDWPSYASDPASSKYADLDQISTANVDKLEIAWTWDSVDNAQILERPQHVPLGFKSTPIKIGDSLYVSTSLGSIVALDAASGSQKWAFDTRAWEHGRPANLGFNHRGVAYWEEGAKRRILVGTNNAFLWSLDAETGKPDTSFGENGRIDLLEGLGGEFDRMHYSVVAAPLVVGNTVIVGAVISDIPTFAFVPRKRADMPPGHVRGFDVASGKQRWIFHSPPRPMETGNDSWEDESWRDTGATNVWTLMSADPDLGYIYLPFGAPNNDFYGGHRPGDNLFGNSLVCLDASTGKLIWYFQTVHHDLWDYDLPAAPNLVDITVDGKPIKAVAQVSKQGFVYVLDRVTGKPVWPIEERPVAASKVPGERSSPTQPIPTRPAPFELQGLSEDDLIDYTPELRAEALKIVSEFEYGGLFTPPSLKGTIQVPGERGGANWSGAALDPATGILYIPSHTYPMVVQLIEPPANTTEYRYMRGGIGGVRGPRRLPLTKPPYSRISALDLNTGEYLWVVPNGDGIRQKIIDMGIPDPGPVGAYTFSMPLLTRSLLFITVTDGKPLLRALDKRSGKILQELVLPAAGSGAPMSYTINGKQYICVAVGGARDAKLVALALPASKG